MIKGSKASCLPPVTGCIEDADLTNLTQTIGGPRFAQGGLIAGFYGFCGPWHIRHLVNPSHPQLSNLKRRAFKITPEPHAGSIKRSPFWADPPMPRWEGVGLLRPTHSGWYRHALAPGAGCDWKSVV